MDVSPLIGKTYSLQDSQGSSDAYYERISGIADRFMRVYTTRDILRIVEQVRRSRGRVPSRGADSIDEPLRAKLVLTFREALSRHTVNVAEHLRTLSLVHRWDRVLAMNELQYHCSLLEIELTNRLNTLSFRRSTAKLALLPHCLRDLTADCHSVIRGDDYVCKGCSGICTVNAVSKLLRRHGVTPYIWMTANLKSLFRRMRKEGKKVGVFGIACVPELARGMRMCVRAGLPVVGVPLDANRCARWWGDFRPNVVNLAVVEHLLGDETLLLSARLKPGSHSQTDR